MNTVVLIRAALLGKKKTKRRIEKLLRKGFMVRIR